MTKLERYIPDPDDLEILSPADQRTLDVLKKALRAASDEKEAERRARQAIKLINRQLPLVTPAYIHAIIRKRLGKVIEF